MIRYKRTTPITKATSRLLFLNVIPKSRTPTISFLKSDKISGKIRAEK